MLYSLTHINQTSPYRVLEYEEDTACFITDSSIVYMVGFIAETNMDIPNAFQLFITPKGRAKHVGTDIKIGQTVAEIVKYTFVIQVTGCRQPETESSKCGSSNIRRWKSMNLYQNVWM